MPRLHDQVPPADCAWEMPAVLHQRSQGLAERFPQWQEEPLTQALIHLVTMSHLCLLYVLQHVSMEE